MAHEIQIGSDPQAKADITAALIRQDVKTGTAEPPGDHVQFVDKPGEDKGLTAWKTPANLNKDGAGNCNSIVRAAAPSADASHVGVVRVPQPDGKEPVDHAFLVADAKPGDPPIVTDGSGKAVGPIPESRIIDPSVAKGANGGKPLPAELYQGASIAPIWPAHTDDLSHVHAPAADRAAEGNAYQGGVRLHTPETPAGVKVAEVSHLAARVVTPPVNAVPRPVSELYPGHPILSGLAEAGKDVAVIEDATKSALERAVPWKATLPMIQQYKGGIDLIAAGKNPAPLPSDPPITAEHVEAAKALSDHIIDLAGAQRHPAHGGPDAESVKAIEEHVEILKGGDRAEPARDAAATMTSEVDAVLPGAVRHEVRRHLPRPRRCEVDDFELSPIFLGDDREEDFGALGSSVWLPMAEALFGALDAWACGHPNDGRRRAPPARSIDPRMGAVTAPSGGGGAPPANALPPAAMSTGGGGGGGGRDAGGRDAGRETGGRDSGGWGGLPRHLRNAIGFGGGDDDSGGDGGEEDFGGGDDGGDDDSGGDGGEVLIEQRTTEVPGPERVRVVHDRGPTRIIREEVPVPVADRPRPTYEYEPAPVVYAPSRTLGWWDRLRGRFGWGGGGQLTGGQPAWQGGGQGGRPGGWGRSWGQGAAARPGGWNAAQRGDAAAAKAGQGGAPLSAAQKNAISNIPKVGTPGFTAWINAARAKDPTGKTWDPALKQEAQAAGLFPGDPGMHGIGDWWRGRYGSSAARVVGGDRWFSGDDGRRWRMAFDAAQVDPGTAILLLRGGTAYGLDLGAIRAGADARGLPLQLAGQVPMAFASPFDPPLQGPGIAGKLSFGGGHGGGSGGFGHGWHRRYFAAPAPSYGPVCVDPTDPNDPCYDPSLDPSLGGIGETSGIQLPRIFDEDLDYGTALSTVLAQGGPPVGGCNTGKCGL